MSSRFGFWIGMFLIGAGGLPLSLHAYGPNVITSDGVVRWPLPVILDTESDQTKDCSGNPQDLSTHVSTAASIWSSAPETGLSTTIRNLGTAVDENNFCDFLFDLGACPFGGNSSGPVDGGTNPIIFDENGEITDQFFGVGAKVDTLGFAGIVLREENSTNAAKGEGVVNVHCMSPCPGTGCGNNSFGSSDVLAFVVHEIGHFLGMNHTQVIVGEPDQTHRTTMFALFDPNSGADITTLERDDQVGIAHLYPDSPDQLANNFCTVTGTIRDENNAEFQCANVIARNTDFTKRLEDAMSFVSGGDLSGGTTQAGRGGFTIKGLTPGETYQIEVKPIVTAPPLNQAASGIIPCNGGNGNPSPPTFVEQTLSDTVTCQSSGGSLVVVKSGQGLTVSAGQTITLDDVRLTNTSGNVANVSSVGTTGGCSLLPR